MSSKRLHKLRDEAQQAAQAARLNCQKRDLLTVCVEIERLKRESIAAMIAAYPKGAEVSWQRAGNQSRQYGTVVENNESFCSIKVHNERTGRMYWIEPWHLFGKATLP